MQAQAATNILFFDALTRVSAPILHDIEDSNATVVIRRGMYLALDGQQCIVQLFTLADGGKSRTASVDMTGVQSAGETTHLSVILRLTSLPAKEDKSFEWEHSLALNLSVTSSRDFVDVAETLFRSILAYLRFGTLPPSSKAH